MKTIEIQTDNEEILEAFKKLAKAFKIGFLERETPSTDTNPSPSGDPYFEDLKNLAEIDAGIEDMKHGRVQRMSLEERRKLFQS